MKQKEVMKKFGVKFATDNQIMKKLRTNKKPKLKLNKGEVTEMQELDLYIDNTRDLYDVRVWLGKNYEKKLKKNKFNFSKAEQGVKNLLVDKGARSYAKEFGGSSKVMFNKNVRQATAKAQVRKIMDDIKWREKNE